MFGPSSAENCRLAASTSSTKMHDQASMPNAVTVHSSRLGPPPSLRLAALAAQIVSSASISVATRSTRPGHRWAESRRCSGSPTIRCRLPTSPDRLLQVRHRGSRGQRRRWRSRRHQRVACGLCASAAIAAAVAAGPHRRAVHLEPILELAHHLDRRAEDYLRLLTHHLVADDASLAGLPERQLVGARRHLWRAQRRAAERRKLASTQISDSCLPPTRDAVFSTKCRSSFVAAVNACRPSRRDPHDLDRELGRGGQGP